MSAKLRFLQLQVAFGSKHHRREFLYLPRKARLSQPEVTWSFWDPEVIHANGGSAKTSRHCVSVTSDRHFRAHATCIVTSFHFSLMHCNNAFLSNDRLQQI